MAPASAQDATYRKDEKVYCFHHELLYEAKVTDVKPNEGDDKKTGFQYKVHYKGWKNTYVFALLRLFICPKCLWFGNLALWKSRLLLAHFASRLTTSMSSQTHTPVTPQYPAVLLEKSPAFLVCLY